MAYTMLVHGKQIVLLVLFHTTDPSSLEVGFKKPFINLGLQPQVKMQKFPAWMQVASKQRLGSQLFVQKRSSAAH